MTLPIDTRQNWRFVTGLEDVQYQVRLLEGTFKDGAATRGKRMPMTEGELQGDAQLRIHGLVWYLWKDLLPVGLNPKYSDRIVDADGQGYQIIKIDNVSLGNRYRLVCLQEP